MVAIWVQRVLVAGENAPLELRSIREDAEGQAASVLQHCLEVSRGPLVVHGGLLGEGIEERASEGAAGGHDAQEVGAFYDGREIPQDSAAVQCWIRASARGPRMMALTERIGGTYVRI